MRTNWISNLQKLIAYGVKHDDMFMVKIITIEKAENGVWEMRIPVNEYPARLIQGANHVIWHIYDKGPIEPLLIKTDKYGKDLGYRVFDEKCMYIILGCRIIMPLKMHDIYHLSDSIGNKIAVAETHGETQLICSAMRTVGEKISVKKAKIT